MRIRCSLGASLCLSVLFLVTTGSLTAQAIRSRLPLAFEPNWGQARPDVTFLLNGSSLGAEFRKDSVTLRLPAGDRSTAQLQMQFLGTPKVGALELDGLLQGRSNYLFGNDPARWLHSVPNYSRVRYRELYPHIDLLFYGNGQELEHDFLIHPGADPGQIAYRLQGVRRVTFAPDGDLCVQLARGELFLRRPRAYQEVNGSHRQIAAGYRLARDGSIRFHLGRYNAAQDLVIDPVISYATYLDNVTDVDSIAAVAVDGAGNTYITGLTFNASFPVTAGSFAPNCSACTNTKPAVFVTKLNAAGTAQVYSTFLGGSGYNQSFGLAVDSNGNAVVTGYTQAADFPVKNPATTVTASTGADFAFICSLAADGSTLNYSSLLGGNSTISDAVAVDTQGNAYITGTTDDPDYPVTSGALDAISPQYPEDDVFVSKFAPAGALAYSAILGNAQPQTGGGGPTGASAIAVDGQGNAYITGGAGALWPTTGNAYATQIAGSPYRSVFVTKLKADGSAMAYSTLVGVGYAYGIALDSSQNAYITGQYDATSFPVTSGAYISTASCCAFLSKISTDGSQLLYSSFFGNPKATTGSTYTNSITVDPQGNVWLSGHTGDPALPLLNPVDANLPNSTNGTYGASSTSFVTELDPTATQLKFSTFIGDFSNAGPHMALDSAGKVHVAGQTSTPIYTTPGAFIASASAPPQGYQFIYPYAETFDPAPASSAVCLGSLSQYGTSFGYLLPGSTLSRTVQVQNCGTASLTISSVSTSNSAFTIPNASNTCSSPIAAGSSCSFTVQFGPTAAQSYTAVITIASNAAIPTTSFPASGTGAEPVASFSSSNGIYPSLVFQPLLVGQTSPVGYVQFFNNGPVPLTISLSQVTITGDFALAGGTCGTTLSAHGQCVFGVTFTPTAAGNRTGTLSVASNDPVHPVVSTTISGTAYSSYPIPSVTALNSPAYPVNSGSSPLTVTVQGNNFFPASVAYVKGVAEPTSYVSGTALRFTLDPVQLSAMGEYPVTIANPSPGGGTSAPYPLLAYISVPLTASALAADPVGGLLYAAIPASAATNPSTVVPINPATGTAMTPVVVASDPRKLAVSDDGTELYVACKSGVLQRINLKTLAIERTFNLPVDPSWGQTYVQEMHVVPGSPQSIVVELFANVDPAEDGAALYNDSGLVNWLPGVNARPTSLQIDSFTFASSPSILYGLGYSVIPQVTVASTGLTYSGSGSFANASGNLIRSDGTLLYTNSGQVWDPATGKKVGTLLEPNGNPLFDAPSILPEPASGHIYVLDTSSLYDQYQSVNIGVYSQSTDALLGAVPFLNIYPPDVTDLVRWGSSGFAFRSVDVSGSLPADNQILILTSSVIAPITGAPVPIVSSVSPVTVYAGGPTYTMQVSGAGFTNASTVLVNGTARTTNFVSSTSLTAQVLAADIAANGQLNVQVTTPAPGGGTSNYAYVSILQPAAQAALSANSLSFGSVGVGVNSAAQTIRLSNSGSLALNITSLSASGDYSVSSNCGSSVAPGSSCTISITFTPTTIGSRNGVLTISDNAPGATQSVILSGTGVSAFTFGAATGSSTSATVTAGSTSTYNLLLTGSSGLSGNVTLSCSGAPSYALCAVSPSTLTLNPGATANFSVTVTTQTTTAALEVVHPRTVLAGLGWLSLLMLPLWKLRRARKWLALCVLCAVALLALGGTEGCGGAGNSGNTQAQVHTTPPGTYTLTITAQQGGASATQSLTLVVN